MEATKTAREIRDQDRAAFDIANYVPTGRANAVSRKYLAIITGLSDRLVRREIERSPAPIINLGYGYFVPDEHDDVDRSEAAVYVAQERARIRSLQDKINTKFHEFEITQLELPLTEPEQEGPEL